MTLTSCTAVGPVFKNKRTAPNFINLAKIQALGECQNAL